MNYPTPTELAADAVKYVSEYNDRVLTQMCVETAIKIALQNQKHQLLKLANKE